MKFDVKLDEKVVPDNHFGSKAIDKVTLYVNNKQLNTKNTNNLPYLARYFTSKLNYSDSNLKQLGELEGFWTNSNPPSESLIGENATDVTHRRKNAVESTSGTVNYWTHQIIFPLDVGLSSLTKPLPKDCFFNITCELAQSCKAVMGLDDPMNGVIGDIVGHLPLKILNPQLEATFIYSDHFDGKLSPYKLSKIKWPFSMPSMQVRLLPEDLDIHQVRLDHGKFTCDN